MLLSFSILSSFSADQSFVVEQECSFSGHWFKDSLNVEIERPDRHVGCD
jgi:hypothetical protein